MKFSELDAKEMNHLKKVAHAPTLEAFKRTAEAQSLMRKKNPKFEPCWECRLIAKKLGIDI